MDRKTKRTMITVGALASTLMGWILGSVNGVDMRTTVIASVSSGVITGLLLTFALWRA